MLFFFLLFLLLFDWRPTQPSFVQGESLGVVHLHAQTSLAEARATITEQLKLKKDAWDYDSTPSSTIGSAYPHFRSQWGALVPAIHIHE